MMFSQEYNFFGPHAERVRQLVMRSAASGTGVFERNVDVLLFAPVIGFLYGRTAQIDRAGYQPTRIFLEQITRELRGIKLNYQLITLLDQKASVSKDERIDNAFRKIEREGEIAESLLRYDEYILGGVDVLYEKLIEASPNNEAYLVNLFHLIEDVHERYNDAVQPETMAELVDLARSN